MESYLPEGTGEPLASGKGENHRHPVLTDSLKLAVASVLGCVASRSSGLINLERPSLETAAFLLYNLWPVIGVVLVPITCRRDWRRGLPIIRKHAQEQEH